MSKQNYEDSTEVLWVKSIIYAIIIITLLTFSIIVPKRVFDSNAPYRFAISMAETTDSNLLLYNYIVFNTKEEFDEGLIYNVEEVRLDFRERNEILAVKIYGVEDTLDFKDNYIFITSPEVPSLKIEYYLVKNIVINDFTITGRTFVMLFMDISRLINNIYLALLFIFFISIFSPYSIKLSRSVSHLIKYYNLKRKP